MKAVTVEIELIDGYLPTRVSNDDDQLEIILGTLEDGKPVVALEGPNPNTLVCGISGESRSIAMRTIAVSAIARGDDVVWMDVLERSTGEIGFEEWFEAIARNPTEIRDAAVIAISELTRRNEILKREGQSHWDMLSATTRREERINRLILIIDDFDYLVHRARVAMNFAGSPEKDRNARTNLASANALYFLTRLAREGEKAGIILVIGCEYPLNSARSSPFRNLIHIVIPRPHLFDSARLMFPKAANSIQRRVKKLSESARGWALIGKADSREPPLFRVAFSRPVEIPMILELLRGPKPKQWNLGQ